MSWRRRIPRVAAASLLLGGGCGQSHAGGDGGTSDPWTDVFERFCRTLQRCDPEYFTEYHDSLAGCVDYFLESYEYWSEDFRRYGEDCVDAILAYYECFVDTYALYCDERAAEEQCIPEYDAYLDACN